MPSLLTLPAEIESIITTHIAQYRDLNSLCRSCKALRATVTPRLYGTVELKVPCRWNRLSSLESLIGSQSQGFNYIRCLRIVVQQSSPSNDQLGDVEELSDSEDEPGCLFTVHTTNKFRSTALNALIRLLFLKIPRQCLQHFRWEHLFTLDNSTLSLLLRHQGATLQTISLGDCNPKWKQADLTLLAMRRLTSLSINSLPDAGEIPRWPFDLLATNYMSLQHLRLGLEEDLAHDFSANGEFDSNDDNRHQATTRFLIEMQRSSSALNNNFIPALGLENLSLCGLDLHMLAKGPTQPNIDLAKLSVLTLESCVGLDEAFPLLAGPGSSQQETKSFLRLHTFILRHENVTQAFHHVLKDFLVTLKPLTSLHVLLQGSGVPVGFADILMVHGKSLCTLVWETRCKARTTPEAETSFISKEYRQLKNIAKTCPRLRALGISLDWKAMARGPDTLALIASAFSKLKHLRTLNIRNLPEATSSDTWIPNDYMLFGLVSMLFEIISGKASVDAGRKPSGGPPLRALAIGASTYGNTKVGTYHYPCHKTADYLRLRIYHVEHGWQTQNAMLSKLQLIATGTPADAEGYVDHPEIFDTYWLDGAHPKPSVTNPTNN